jgi:hypothetical protein
MTDDEAHRLAAAWRNRAAYFRRTVETMNQGRCHAGARELRQGMAAMADLCADELDERVRHTRERP